MNILTRSEVEAKLRIISTGDDLRERNEAWDAIVRSYEGQREQILMERGLAATFIPAARYAAWQERLQIALSMGENK